jgi:hypothetical protein
LHVIHFNIIIPTSKSSKWPPFNRSPYWNSIHVSRPTWDDGTANYHHPHFTTLIVSCHLYKYSIPALLFEIIWKFPRYLCTEVQEVHASILSPSAMHFQISSGCNKTTAYAPHSFFWTLI